MQKRCIAILRARMKAKPASRSTPAPAFSATLIFASKLGTSGGSLLPAGLLSTTRATPATTSALRAAIHQRTAVLSVAAREGVTRGTLVRRLYRSDEFVLDPQESRPQPATCPP